MIDRIEGLFKISKQHAIQETVDQLFVQAALLSCCALIVSQIGTCSRAYFPEDNHKVDDKYFFRKLLKRVAILILVDSSLVHAWILS